MNECMMFYGRSISMIISAHITQVYPKIINSKQAMYEKRLEKKLEYFFLFFNAKRIKNGI